MLRRGFQKPFRLNHAKNASIFVAAFGCEGFDVEKIDDFEVSITNQVKGALNGALQYSKTKIAEQNITNISLSEFVVFANEYVQSESGKDYKDVGFAVDGENESKLIVNIKLSNTTDVSGIEFNLGDIAKINAAGSRNLSSSLEFLVAIDLDKNSDGNYLESKQLSRRLRAR